eukprot:780345-Amphidinium_carterae.1
MFHLQPIIHRTKSRPCSVTEGVTDEKDLRTRAVLTAAVCCEVETSPSPPNHINLTCPFAATPVCSSVQESLAYPVPCDHVELLRAKTANNKITHSY